MGNGCSIKYLIAFEMNEFYFLLNLSVQFPSLYYYYNYSMQFVVPFRIFLRRGLSICSGVCTPFSSLKICPYNEFEPNANSWLTMSNSNNLLRPMIVLYNYVRIGRFCRNLGEWLTGRFACLKLPLLYPSLTQYITVDRKIPGVINYIVTMPMTVL